MISAALIRKYNVPGPRYTSYPTVPHWHRSPSDAEWKDLVRRQFLATNSSEGISLYIHLPYCESLCTYCGCNKRITKNHQVELPYIETVLQEWRLYTALLEGVKPRIREIHLGGGTPTFFSPARLEQLVSGILADSELCENAELSFEAHPNSTSKEHLETLYRWGFRRLSLGVQDFDPVVQITVNRIQTYEQVQRVTEQARAIGYESINYDLIYGLPRQTQASVADTLTKVQQLHPDRIAFYSYAHVPWVSKSQRGFSEEDLPSDEVKRALYEMGKEWLEEMGYVEIGMDHFSLPSDALYRAMQTQQLHRNFMGYTTGKTTLMIGLGVSSISDAWWGFAQNEKVVEDYLARVQAGEIPIFRGHLLDETDELIRRHILNIMCRFETHWTAEQAQSPIFQEALELLRPLQADGLVELLENGLRVPEQAKPFVRNICMCFDVHLQEASTVGGSPIFSKTI